MDWASNNRQERYWIAVSEEELAMLLSAVTVCASGCFQKGGVEHYGAWQKLREKIRQPISTKGLDYEERHPIFNL